jgi:CSLREA domain-containing protein
VQCNTTGPLPCPASSFPAVAITLPLLLCVLAAPAFAGDITVNTTADDNVANGSCSLREAMQSQFNGAFESNASSDVLFRYSFQ